jgi:hypothetical protein
MPLGRGFFDQAEIAVSEDNGFFVARGPCDDLPERIRDERLSRKMEDGFPADAVDQSREISVLERGDLQLAFVDALSPLIQDARLRDDDDLGA